MKVAVRPGMTTKPAIRSVEEKPDGETVERVRVDTEKIEMRDADNATRMRTTKEGETFLDDKERAVLDVKKAESKYAEARREAERFREEIAHLRETHARELGDVRAPIAEDKAHVAEAIRAATDAIRREAAAERKKERKRSAAYKEKCLQAHNREKRLTSTVKATTRAQAEDLVA